MSSSDIVATQLDNYDTEYIMIIKEIENRLDTLRKHDRIRLIAWIKKLSLITSNMMWKKNRNLYAFLMLDMLINSKFEEPLDKFPPEGHLKVLSQTRIKTRLSQQYKKVLPSNNITNVNINMSDVIIDEEKIKEERVKENDMSNNNVEYQDKRNSQIIEDNNNEINDINNQNNQNNNGEQNAKEQAVLENNDDNEVNNEKQNMKFTFMNQEDHLRYLYEQLGIKDKEISLLEEEKNLIIQEIETILQQNNNLRSNVDSNNNNNINNDNTTSNKELNNNAKKTPNKNYTNTSNKLKKNLNKNYNFKKFYY